MMTISEVQLRELTRLLDDVAEELDVPPSKYEDAKRSYDAVGDWLSREGSALARYSPKIYPQGSFTLGTAINPQGADHYDVDVVCVLDVMHYEVTQQQLKNLVGDRLKESGTYDRMLDPREGRRRCWTLNYADESRFHLDVCPAVPDKTCMRWHLASTSTSCGTPSRLPTERRGQLRSTGRRVTRRGTWTGSRAACV